MLAGCALGIRALIERDQPSLVFAVICLALAGYWLLIDREPVEPGPQPLDREGSPDLSPGCEDR